jgi:hypothetical protein
MSKDKDTFELGSWARLRKAATDATALLNGGKPKSAVEQRKLGERKVVKPDDGRRQRATGRTKVFNTKLRPDFRDKLFALAAQRDIGVAELLEQIVAEWEAGKRGR